MIHVSMITGLYYTRVDNTQASQAIEELGDAVGVRGCVRASSFPCGPAGRKTLKIKIGNYQN
jgi:hypothetical protein